MHYSPETFENIVSVLPGYVRWKDSDQIYLGCNSLQAKSLGLAVPNDIVGKTDKDLVWKDQADAFRKVEQQVIETGVPVTVEEELPLAGNPKAVFVSKKTPLRDKKGNITGLMSVGIDISNLREQQASLLQQAQEAYEAASQAKTEFIHNIEHDIRTPFSGIISVAKYLCTQQHDPATLGHLADIERSAEKLLGYFNEVLEVSYQATGQIASVEKQFDLRDMLADLFAIQRPSATSRNIKMIQEYAENVPSLMIGDHYRLERVLLNLLSNAIKFTDKGYIEVCVDVAKRIDIKNILLRIVVQDSGVGIPESQMKLVFEQFSRVSPSYKGVYDGAGMGLYLAKKFLEDMNGEIDIKSEQNKGTVVTCLLPIKLPLMPADTIYSLSELDAI